MMIFNETVAAPAQINGGRDKIDRQPHGEYREISVVWGWTESKCVPLKLRLSGSGKIFRQLGGRVVELHIFQPLITMQVTPF